MVEGSVPAPQGVAAAAAGARQPHAPLVHPRSHELGPLARARHLLVVALGADLELLRLDRLLPQLLRALVGALGVVEAAQVDLPVQDVPVVAADLETRRVR